MSKRDIKIIVLSLVMVLLLIMPSAAFAYQVVYYSEPPYAFISDELVLKFRADVGPLSLNAKYGAYPVKTDAVLGTEILKITNFNGKTLSEIRDEYRAEYTLGWWPELNYVELNYRIQGAALDYKGSEVYSQGTSDPYALAVMEVQKAVDAMTKHNNVVVAVLDTGLDLDNTEFAGKTVSGKNILANTVPQDDNGHGTEISGTVVSKTYGLTSLLESLYTSSIKIMPVKILNNACTGDCADVASGIRYAADNGANIILMSLESPYGSILVEEAINYAYGKGVTIVAAAGSTYGTVMYPAKYPHVIAVGATNSNELVPSYSNYGSDVDISAPGDVIKTTTKDSSNPVYRSGSSLAAGFVAGVAALALSQDNTLSPSGVENVLTSTALDFGVSGNDSNYGAGRVNALEIVTAAGNGGSKKNRDYEPNDTFDYATELKNQILNTHIESSTDIDIFKTFKGITVGHTLRVTVNMPFGLNNAKLAVYDATPSHNIVGSEQNLHTGLNSIDFIVPTTGSYYLKIYSSSGSFSTTNSYAIQYDDVNSGDVNEPNDTFAEATQITDTISNSNLSPAGDLDIYKYNLQHDTGLQVAVSNVPGDMTPVVKIFKADGTLFGSPYVAASNGMGISVNVPINVSGYVYIEVSDAVAKEINGKYTVTVGEVDTVPPVISNYYLTTSSGVNPTAFSSAQGQYVTGSFTLSENAAVNLTYTQDGTSNSWNISLGSLPAGTHSFTWDGKKDGVNVADGNYTLKIDAADSNGNVATPVMQTVRVDNTPPKVQYVSPSGSSVPIDVSCTIVLSEEINPNTYSLNLKQGGNLVAADTTYDAYTHTLTLKPKSVFSPGTSYSLTLSNCKDLSGNIMVEQSWNFSTVNNASAVGISLVQPTIAAQLEKNTVLKASISKENTQVTFEYSKDGSAWSQIATVSSSGGSAAYTWDIQTLEGNYLLRAKYAYDSSHEIYSQVVPVTIVPAEQHSVNPGTPSSFLGGDVKIIAPSGSSLGTVTVKRLSIGNVHKPPADLFMVGDSVDFSTTGSFNGQKIIVTFKYDVSKYNFIDESTVGVRYFNTGTGKWEVIEGTVDTRQKTVTAELAHFSEYAVMAKGIKYYMPTPKKMSDGSSLQSLFIADNITHYPYEIYLPNETQPWNYRIHSNYTKNTDACASCHKTHTAVGESLLQWYSVYDTCMACHDGTVSTTYNVVDGIIPSSDGKTYPTYGGMFGVNNSQTGSTLDGNISDVNSISNHNVKGAVQITAAPGGSVVEEDVVKDNGQAYAMWNKTFGCESCHSPHGQGGNARILSPDPNGYATKNNQGSFNLASSDGVSTTVYAIFDSKGNKVTLIRGYPYKIVLKDINGIDITDNFNIFNFGDSTVGSYTYLIKKDGPGYSKTVQQIVYVNGTSSLKVRMQILDYLQTTENVRHISGINTFCGACHTDYNTESVVASGNNPDTIMGDEGKRPGYGNVSGTFSKAHRHAVGIAWNYGGAADANYIGYNKLMMTYGDNPSKQYISCLTCHFAHGTSNLMWQRWISKFSKDIGSDGWGTAPLSLAEIGGSTALKRLPNMAVCEACHQKSSANEGYLANSKANTLGIASILNGIFSTAGAEYVGVTAGNCVSCHPIQYNKWYDSSHRQTLGIGKTTILNNADDKPYSTWLEGAGTVVKIGSSGTYYTVDDVVYTLGFKRAQAYVVKDGEHLRVLPYKWMTKSAYGSAYGWKYDPPEFPDTWQNMAYEEKCIGCHTTGYNPDTNKQVDIGISCEACHGPAGNHIKYSWSDKNIVAPITLSADLQDDICGQCHALGKNNVYANRRDAVGFKPGNALTTVFSVYTIINDSDNDGTVSNGTYHFWPDGSARSNYMEYNDFTSLISGKHNAHYDAKISCLTCHGSCSVNDEGRPLKTPGSTICATCHDIGLQVDMGQIIDAYMPYTAQTVSGSVYDLRSHRSVKNFVFPYSITNPGL